MKVSIIVPVYNVEPYIARCLQSVMDQTYKGPIECLLVDDCGTDNSMSVIGDVLDKYQGSIDFKVLHHEYNRGLSAARNTGTDAATGDYVYYLDSDDALTPDCLALMVAEVEKHSGLEMVMGAFEIHRIDGSSKVMLASERGGFYDNNVWIRYDFFKNENCLEVVAWNRLVSVTFLKEHGIRFKEGVIHEDEHWSFFVYKKLTKLYVIQKVTYLYYKTPQSIMSSNTPQKRADAMYQILADVIMAFDNPLKSLQVFKYLEHFRFSVLPHVSKRQTRWMYFRFFRELFKMGKLKIAFYWLVNWFCSFRHAQLYYNMIPDAYSLESKRCLSRKVH